MKKIGLIYLKGLFLLKMSNVEMMNTLLSAFMLSKKFRQSRALQYLEERLMKKRQHMNTALKKYFIAGIFAKPEAFKRYALEKL